MKKITSDNIYAVLGIIGSVILIYGQTLDPPQLAYSIGSFCLFLTAIHYKLVYFIALELILTAGNAAILLNIGSYLQIALPILLCLQLAFYYIIMGQGRDFFLFLGIFGIAFLSIGFSYKNEWIFLIGGSSIATYAFSCVYKGMKICYIWAILNSIFSIIALYYIFTGG